MGSPIRQALCADTIISDVFHLFQKIPDPKNLARMPSEIPVK